jgi:hypothetical protein
VRRKIPALAAALFLLSAAQALAAQITFEFNCILVSKKACSPSAVFGTMTLSDSPDNGDLLLTLDLVGSYDKFRHLMLNYSGPAERITSSDRQAELDQNDYKLRPYKARFDVGDDGGKGWSYSGAGPYSTILYGWTDHGRTKPKYTAGRSNVNLVLEDFLQLDRFGQIYAALYIKDPNRYRCDDDDDGPCAGRAYRNGLSLGATLVDSSATVPTPEPGSLTLLGIGLAASGLWARRRKSSRSDAPSDSGPRPV